MLIATITLLMVHFGGGGGFSFQIFEKAIKDSITDKTHRKELVAEVDRAGKTMKDFRKDLKGLSKEFKNASVRYDATRGELGEIVARVDSRRTEATRELLDARFSLREKMSEKEWNVMYELALENARKNKE